MSSMKTVPTGKSVETFLLGVSEHRRAEAQTLITIMQEISGENPVMWGPIIVGFGSMHYKYESGREGDMPILAFSPRKANLTIYFKGFDDYAEKLQNLGKHKISKACLYINKLPDINLNVLQDMLQQSYETSVKSRAKPTSVEEYILTIPAHTRPKFHELRQVVKNTLPDADEVLSYGIIGYRIDNKRARVYISGWKDHVAMYPLPKNKELREKLAPFIKGKGTLWFKLDEPLPKLLIKSAVKELAS